MSKARDAAEKAPQAATLTGAETLQNKTLVDYKETEYALASTVIDPANGSIQYKILTAPTTFTETLENGQSISLLIEGAGTHAITWPTLTWVSALGNTAPIYTAKDLFILWKVNNVLYAAYAGSYV